MKKFFGYTLLELVIFITIIGVITVGLITAYMEAVQNMPRMLYSAKANYYAVARTEFILGHMHQTGNLEDPCVATPTVPICQTDANYSVNSNFSVWGSPSLYVLTVTASGGTENNGYAQIITLVTSG